MNGHHPADLAARWQDESRQDLPPDVPIANDLILSHIDVDGMVSAAGLLRTLPDDTGLRFTSYRLVADYLTRLAASESAPRRLWVADLGIANGDLGSAVDALDRLRSAGTRIYWFDHHAWEPEAADAIEQRCDAFHVVPGVARPAALIVTDAVHPGPRFAKMAREILLERGATTDPVAAAWFRCMACLMVERDWAAVHRAVRRLSRLESLHADEIDRLNSKPSSKEAALIGDFMEVNTTGRGTRYGLLDLRHLKIRREALRHVCGKQDLDLLITVPSDCEIVVDRMDGVTDLMRLAELESLDSVTHVCPNLNPILIELAGREPAAHGQAMDGVVTWIEQEL